MLGSVYGGLFYSLASEETATLVLLTSELVCLLLCVPLFFGYASLCIKLVRGENAAISELFAYYTSARTLTAVYTHFLKLLPMLILKLVVPYLLITLIFNGLESFAPYFMPQHFDASTATKILQGVFFIPAALIIVLCLYLFGSNIVKFLCFCAGESTVGIIYRKGEFFALRLSMLPLYALSLLSFGVLFIAYTFPITMIVYTLGLGLDKKEFRSTKVHGAALHSSISPALSDIKNEIAPADTADITDNNGDTAVFDINDFKENN